MGERPNQNVFRPVLEKKEGHARTYLPGMYTVSHSAVKLKAHRVQSSYLDSRLFVCKHSVETPQESSCTQILTK